MQYFFNLSIRKYIINIVSLLRNCVKTRNNGNKCWYRTIRHVLCTVNWCKKRGG